jgi:hypothetical protein
MVTALMCLMRKRLKDSKVASIPFYFVAFNPRLGKWGVFSVDQECKVHSWHLSESIAAHEAQQLKSGSS